MITGIEINNFRCFEKSKINGFGQVNLIGGQNNIGKTALLEAIYLAGSFGYYNKIQNLLTLRNFSDEFIKRNPEQIWDYFFYNQNSNSPIFIKSHNSDSSVR
ncbi:MAG: AAA family ATPase, partial [Chloroflexota bacterium]